MKTIIVLWLGLLMSVAALADDCGLRQYDGVWRNRLGVQFELKSDGACSKIQVTDLGSGRAYSVDANGFAPGASYTDFAIAGNQLRIFPYWISVTDDSPGFAGTLTWEVSAPYLPLRPGIEASFYFDAIKNPGSSRFDVLRPGIGSFDLIPGSAGNFFEDGLKAVVRLLNRLELGPYLSMALRKNNTLYRVR